MSKVINCDCGFVVRGDTDDDLVNATRRHAKEEHDMDLTVEQILAMAKPAN
jgi:predicted small metal-binding protein